VPVSEDDAFYDELVAPLESRMLRTAWRIVRDPDRARDALQDALTVIWKRRDRIRAHPNPEALILRICIHAAVDMLRKERRYRRTMEAEAQDRPAPEPRGPGATVEQQELQTQVLSALGQLSEKQAAAVFMRVVEETDYALIAAALHCSQVTARIHVMRGRARLGRLLAHLVPRRSGGAG
jgi:RNA polymerase sigma-70 factor (ECF subfamily)